MGFECWFREDVAHILTALASAGQDHGPEYLRALRDVGLAFGVAQPEPRFRREVAYQTDLDVPIKVWVMDDRSSIQPLPEDEAIDAARIVR